MTVPTIIDMDFRVGFDYEADALSIMSKIPGDNPSMSKPKVYWLVAGEVVIEHYKRGEKRIRQNALVSSERGYFTRRDLADAQQAMMQKCVQFSKLTKEDQITDVFIMSVNNLGEQTMEEFHAGFADAQIQAMN